MKWSVIYERAIREDGSLYFPERLSKEFLESKRKVMGSYLYSNQYLNEVIPEEDRKFKREWFKYYTQIPANAHTFCFIDPAISQEDTADFTGITIAHVTHDKKWYVEVAQRYKFSPTQLIEKIFEINSVFRPMAIGVETVAFQKVLVYLVAEEMLKRGINVPIKEVNPGTKRSKELRIMSLVPRFEWGQIYLNQGLVDFELELLQFPRSNHDDIIDSLSQMEDLVFYPEKEKEFDGEPGPNHPRYESWYIKQLAKRQTPENF